MISFETNDEVLINLATRFKRIRKIRNITQQMLAKKSNVSYGSIKRFERTGDISLISLTRLCEALDIRYEIEKLFNDMPYRSIEEVLKR